MKSDSQLVIDSLTALLGKHKDKGCIGAANSYIMHPLVAISHKRKGLTMTRAKLANATQALIYKGILEIQLSSKQRRTCKNLDIICWATKVATGSLSTDMIIWKSMRNKALSKEV